MIYMIFSIFFFFFVAQYLYLQTVSLQQYKVQYPIKYNSMFFKRIEKYIKYYI